MFAWRLTDDSNSSHKCGTYYTSKCFMHMHRFNSFMSMRWILWRGDRGTEDLRNLPGLHRELAIELRDEPSQSESIASALNQCSVYKYTIYTGLHGKESSPYDLVDFYVVAQIDITSYITEGRVGKSTLCPQYHKACGSQSAYASPWGDSLSHSLTFPM